MTTVYVKSFADLMAGHHEAEIIDPVHAKVVRRLTVNGDRVFINAMEPTIYSVPLDTPIGYQPWFCDRGSLLFPLAELPDGRGKICTEYDTIRYKDGEEAEIRPAL